MPTFTLIQGRSNHEIPLVHVNFIDGSSDYLVLYKYEDLDRHFIGHLENDPEACVAMVCHPEHSELTILSDRIIGSPMYKWNSNGSVEIIQDTLSRDALRLNGWISSYLGKTVVDSCIPIIPDEAVQAELNLIERLLTVEQANSVPKTANLQIQVHTILKFIAS